MTSLLSRNNRINSNKGLYQFNRYMNDCDNEDGLSIKSGISIDSDEEDADNVSEAYQEIKEVLLTNQPRVVLKPKDVNFFEWNSKDFKEWNNNFGKTSTNSQKHKKKLLPDLKHTYFKQSPASISQLSNGEKLANPKYQHFNNWKMHLLNYKQTKGYSKNIEQQEVKVPPNGKKMETPPIKTIEAATSCSNREYENNVKTLDLNKENSFIDSFESMSGFNMISVGSFKKDYVEYKPEEPRLLPSKPIMYSVSEIKKHSKQFFLFN